MTRSEAENLRDTIKDMVAKCGQWVVVSEENVPKLKKIKLEVSILIDEAR